MKRSAYLFGFVMVFCFLATGISIAEEQGDSLLPAGPPTHSAPADSAIQAKIQNAYGKLPLYFIENKGQLDVPVAYYVQGSDTMLYFTREGVTFGLTGEQGCGGGSCFAKALLGRSRSGAGR